MLEGNNSNPGGASDLLVHGSLVIGHCSQHIRHDAARANGIHSDIVRRQGQSHTPANQNHHYKMLGTL